MHQNLVLSALIIAVLIPFAATGIGVCSICWADFVSLFRVGVSVILWIQERDHLLG